MTPHEISHGPKLASGAEDGGARGVVSAEDESFAICKEILLAGLEVESPRR